MGQGFVSKSFQEPAGPGLERGAPTVDLGSGGMLLETDVASTA